MAKRAFLYLGLGLFAVLVLLQAIPYGRNHANPPVRVEPLWDTPQTRVFAVRACFDCHSNQTVWPWYSNLAPVSWLVQRDVDEGRERLNFSEWDRPQEEPWEAVEAVSEGEMPPGNYLLLHPSARLAPAEARAFVKGLQATLGSGRGGPEAKGDAAQRNRN
jgi:hypothetical protein